MSTTFDALVNDCLQTLQGYGLSQPRAAFLSIAVDADDLQFAVSDATGFEQGVAEIDNETVFIESVDYGSSVLTIAPDGRGYYGSVAATHSSAARVTMAPVWPKSRIASAINEAITAVYPNLFGVGSTTFAFNPSVTTYEIPAAAEKILKVTADTLGSSREQAQIRRYSWNSSAPTATFASGNTITLEQAPAPGRGVTVTYQKRPTEITYGAPFTDSGLPESSKLAIKYLACSNLTALMDASRLPVDTAVADEYDPSRSGVGTASRISTLLYQRYLLELDTEAKSLRATYPVPVVVRTR